MNRQNEKKADRVKIRKHHIIGEEQKMLPLLFFDNGFCDGWE